MNNSNLKLRRAHLESMFPRLRESNYRIVSPACPYYNCLHFAMNDRASFIKPRNWKVETIAEIFQTRGFVPCKTADYEEGYAKVAIYSDIFSVNATHVCRMDQPNIWLHKLGEYEVIETDTLSALEGMVGYGFVVKILSKPINPTKEH